MIKFAMLSHNYVIRGNKKRLLNIDKFVNPETLLVNIHAVSAFKNLLGESGREGSRFYRFSGVAMSQKVYEFG